MDIKLSLDFLRAIGGLKDLDYLLSIIKFHAAPTMEGIKPAALISFNRDNRDLYQLWNVYRDQASKILNLVYFEVHSDSKRVLVLFYNVSSIEAAMHNADNLEFLKKLGYGNSKSTEDVLENLKNRFSCHFPHEIGILLGIPREDVEGFIKNSGRNFIINGYWKVYSDPIGAGRLFREYDTARIDAMKKYLPAPL